MDINGHAEISLRTIDALGLGNAVIRPKLLIQYHNPLIPDYHYAALKCDDQSNLKEMADAYIEKFEELKNNPELVRFLGENGRKWYVENARLDGYVNIHSQIINLEKLK
jgi:hypothetical protein